MTSFFRTACSNKFGTMLSCLTNCFNEMLALAMSLRVGFGSGKAFIQGFLNNSDAVMLKEVTS